MIEGNILTAGMTYNTDRDMTVIDIVDGVTKEWSYPKGTVAKILKHKLWSEGAYVGVDYIVKMPDGYKMEESAKTVHRILGLPPLKVNRKKM